MVKGQIKLAMLRRAVQERVVKLREAGNIEIVDPGLLELSEQVKEEQKKRNQKQLEQGVGGGKSDKQN